MWTNEYARELSRVADATVVIPDEESILDFTRRVAHGTDRKNAPLATFLAGWFVGARVAAGVDPVTAWEQAEQLGDGLLES